MISGEKSKTSSQSSGADEFRRRKKENQTSKSGKLTHLKIISNSSSFIHKLCLNRII